jgi:hypothetical protein
MQKLLIFLTIFVSLPAFCEVYFLGQSGYGQLNQNAVASNNVYPSGLTYGAGAGIRQNYFEFEGVLQKLDLAGEIDHDGAGNTFKHEQTSITFALNFYLSKRFYARLGYSINRIDQSLGEDVSDASMEGARDAYKMKENTTADGVVYGGGYVVYDSTKLGIFTQFESFSMPTADANVWNISLGFRFYVR